MRFFKLNFFLKKRKLTIKKNKFLFKIYLQMQIKK